MKNVEAWEGNNIIWEYIRLLSFRFSVMLYMMENILIFSIVRWGKNSIKKIKRDTRWRLVCAFHKLRKAISFTSFSFYHEMNKDDNHKFFMSKRHTFN